MKKMIVLALLLIGLGSLGHAQVFLPPDDDGTTGRAIEVLKPFKFVCRCKCLSKALLDSISETEEKAQAGNYNWDTDFTSDSDCSAANTVTCDGYTESGKRSGLLRDCTKTAVAN